jgi:cellulose synthase/poly-beta-1,6-N-acetylglucosamine synthase-like glycosyltransferase
VNFRRIDLKFFCGEITSINLFGPNNIVMITWLAWLLIGSSLFMVTFYMNVYRKMPVKEELADSELDEEPKVSILMPAYNEEEVVERAIRSALNMDYSNLKVIFVDDGSTDRTLEKARKYSEKDEIKIIEHVENQGKGEALNTALENADSDYTIVQDADSQIDGDVIRKGVNKLDADEDTGAVMTSIRPLEAETFVQKMQKIEYTLTNFYRNLMAYINILDMAPGAYSMYRTEEVKELGGFDEDNLTEDLELAWRIKKEGKSIEMAFHESAKTEFPATFRQLYGQRVRWARGFMSNAWEKRDMFFNEKYGWFGKFQLPTQLILPVFGIMGLAMIAAGFWEGIRASFIDIWTTGLSLPGFGGLDPYRTALNFPAVIYVPLVASLSFSVVELKVAYSESDSRFKDVLPLLIYFGTFFIIKGVFWMAAILKELGRSEEVWS